MTNSREKDNTLAGYNPRFLRIVIPVTIGTVGSLVTIILGFYERWEIVSAIIIACVALGGASWLLQFYRRQLQLRFNKMEEKTVASIEAREVIVKEREREINRLKMNNEFAMNSLHYFTQTCLLESQDVKERFNQILNKANQLESFLPEAIALGHSCINKVLARIPSVFDAPLESIHGKAIPTWVAIRQLQPDEKVYRTIARHGQFNPARECHSEDIDFDKSIPQMVLEKHAEDGAGVVLFSPEHSKYHSVVNDELGENKCMLAGPIILGNQLLMILVLNSPIKDAFQENLMPYMRCICGVLSMITDNLNEVLIDVNEMTDE